MSGSLLQGTRIGELTTPFGKDVLVLHRMTGSEAISENFDLRVDALSKRPHLDFAAAIGEHCSVRLNTIRNGVRFFDGLLTAAEWLGAEEGAYRYQLTLRPWFELLGHRVNRLIFHEMTAPDIVAKIFAAHGGLARFERRLTRAYPTLEYTVQCEESDLDFCRRLMEAHGIAYYFRHGRGEHTLVMVDGIAGYETVPGAVRNYYPLDRQYRRDEEHFSRIVAGRRFTQGRTTLNDYDFKKPGADLTAERRGDTDFAHGDLEVYRFPGRYVERGEGEELARTRIEAVRGLDRQMNAEGDCMSLSPGHLVTLAKHPSGEMNREYLTLSASHHYRAEDYVSGAAGDEDSYEGVCTLLAAEIPFLPPATTPRPRAPGPQTARVVGDGEIDCDEHGRILVRFHWDREGDQSMRCRVSQVWAGAGFGGIFIPRVGMEVIVDFLDGDPDRPVVTGCLYNGDNRPPYPLADEKTVAGWKSNSTTGGGGYNELALDDSKGDELVRLHAQRDLEAKVLHDERRDVLNDRTVSIGRDDGLTVGRDLTVTAGRRITLRVGASSIVIDAGSVTIQSPSVAIRAAQEFTSQAGMTSEHAAGVTMDIKGALVKINT
ncbi:type VI secretion system Vgr family protein [Jiella sonneratiae]|uniref:Type VI secretion system tip protein VgrG n=1 Tax=Jiella sonneratiae TaxID=2816856 RepID=A0ABS3J835_9HYPH|nr:type VI secretion system tip protein TssI/VgrG [Jiella sonneratiae]MBO0905123.1 type VI secretion system tip protein VgrG [Jiella sonneratiae]